MQAAVEAGLGVAVLRSRFIGDEIIAWPCRSVLPPVPIVHQIARTVPGETAGVSAALVDVIADQLVEPSPSSLAR